MASKVKIIKKLDEVVKPYCCNGYCILKEIIACSHSDGRFLVQLKCIEHFKYEESETQKKDIGWDDAHAKWVDKGFAARFADYYDEELTAEQIYQKIIETQKK
jgi:hypothetical protein